MASAKGVKTRRHSGGRIVAGLRAWGRRHAFSLLSSLGSLARYPLASLMTVSVVAFALALPLALQVMLSNTERLAQQWERLDTLSVFLEPGQDEAAVNRLVSRWSNWPQVLAVDPISPEQGLEELSLQLDLGTVDDLAEHPLPWVLEVIPSDDMDRVGLLQRLEQEETVASVVIDLQWLERLDAITALLGQLTWLLALLLALGVMVIIGNTIRLDVQNRREEIEVMALVGATPAFVRRPFLYTGMWFGLLGGVLAWLMVVAGLLMLDEPVQRLGQTYGEPFFLQGPSPVLLGALLLASLFTGVLGAWLVVAQHLRRIGS